MNAYQRECKACDRTYFAQSNRMADQTLCKWCQQAGKKWRDYAVKHEATDEERLEAALKKLVSCARYALEHRFNLANPPERLHLERALEAYCDLVRELYGKDAG